MTAVPDPSSLLNQPHSKRFVECWRDVVAAHYRWETDGIFCLVPKLSGGFVRSCVPLLNYTHLRKSDAEELINKIDRGHYHIRLLGDLADQSNEGMPVTMRVDLSSGNKNPEWIWKHCLSGRVRNLVRAASKSGATVEFGSQPELMADFYACFVVTSKRLGFPCLKKELFARLAKQASGTVFVCYSHDHRPLSAGLVFSDDNIRWLAWGAKTKDDLSTKSGELLYWTMLKESCESGFEIFDYGRSPYGSGTYRFKKKFGAVPVPILLLSDDPRGVYQKYELPQKIWKRLPGAVTVRLGPVLCRYLADY